MYRCYDISDMIKVLKPFCLAENTEKNLSVSTLMQNNLSAKDAKAKKHALELELIKMQQELLELELKYGQIKVELPEDDPLPEKRAKDEEARSEEA